MTEAEIRLVVPNEDLLEAYMDFVRDWHEAGEKLTRVPYEQFDVAAHLRTLRNLAQGIDLPDGGVPCSVYWLIRGRQIIGECGLQHRLTEALKDFGGHIGYSIRPSERGKGYGTKILKLALEKAHARSINRVLITCSKDNIASARVIQNNGGVLDSESFSDQAGRITQRYWIEL